MQIKKEKVKKKKEKKKRKRKKSALKFLNRISIQFQGGNQL